MRKALVGTDVDLEWTNGSKLCDLDYADDVVLLDTSRDRMQSMTKAVENKGGKVRANYERQEMQSRGLKCQGRQ